MDIHLSALRIDQHAPGIVVEEKWDVHALVSHLNPLAVPAPLLPLPRHAAEIEAGHAGDRRRQRIRARGQSIHFNQPHGRAADF